MSIGTGSSPLAKQSHQQTSTIHKSQVGSINEDEERLSTTEVVPGDFEEEEFQV